jgi:hypothetical protein
MMDYGTDNIGVRITDDQRALVITFNGKQWEQRSDPYLLTTIRIPPGPDLRTALDVAVDALHREALLTHDWTKWEALQKAISVVA